jgi:hypothetical protein
MVSSRRQLHRETPRRCVDEPPSNDFTVELTGVHAPRPKHIFFPHGASMTGGLALRHTSVVATRCFFTHERSTTGGGDAPMMVARLLPPRRLWLLPRPEAMVTLPGSCTPMVMSNGDHSFYSHCT